MHIEYLRDLLTQLSHTVLRISFDKHSYMSCDLEQMDYKHLFGHTHFTVICRSNCSWQFLGKGMWSSWDTCTGSCMGLVQKGTLHLIGGHSQSQVFGLNDRGGKQISGLHLGLHWQLYSSVMQDFFMPIGIHRIFPQQLNCLKHTAFISQVTDLNGVHICPCRHEPEHVILVGM